MAALSHLAVMAAEAAVAQALPGLILQMHLTVEMVAMVRLHLFPVHLSLTQVAAVAAHIRPALREQAARAAAAMALNKTALLGSVLQTQAVAAVAMVEEEVQQPVATAALAS